MYYYLFILAIACERLVELIVSRRNAEWSLAHGGREFGRGHYPVMTTMHGLLLVGCVTEVWALHRPFIPWLGWPMLLVVVLSTITRWWCATVLGKHWNPPRVIVIPPALPPWCAVARTDGCTIPITRRWWPKWRRFPPGALGVGDRDRLHRGQRPGVEHQNPHREQGSGLCVTAAGAA